MHDKDPRKSPSQGKQSDRSAQEPEHVVVPGKRTRSASIPSRPSRAPALVQQQRAPATEAAHAGLTARWLDTAMRPDLHSPPVQMQGGEVQPASEIQRLAAEGIAGPASTLPHLDRVQQSFGSHDVRGIDAHAGGSAARASEAMGAVAYATGNHVAFGGTPDLHTVAHEAAHVVQQRAGVHLQDGVGTTGDTYERHADAVADRVVQGESAQDLLAPYAAATGAAPVQRSTGPVQRRVWIGGRKPSEASLMVPPGGLAEAAEEVLLPKSRDTVAFEPLWQEVRGELCAFLQVEPQALDEAVAERVRAKLVAWGEQVSASENARHEQEGVAPKDNAQMASYTEERVYTNVRDLAVALFHESEPGYAERLAGEDQKAALVKAQPAYAAALRVVVTTLASQLSPDEVEELQLLAQNSRYRSFSTLLNPEAILSGGASVDDMVIFLDEATSYAPIKDTKAFKELKVDMRQFGDFRTNGWTVNESNPWVQNARQLGAPLQAGPSGTTNRVLALARMLGCGNEITGRVAWIMFAFFNGMWRGYSGTHRLEEVMAVAAQHCTDVMAYDPEDTGERRRPKL